MSNHEKINYVEFPCTDMVATRRFFADAFGWTFEEYGADYLAFSNAGLEGGFYRSEQRARTDSGSALVVFFSDALEVTLEKVEANGGEIIQPIFSFPGGRRFHFAEPSGNEFAVWSDVQEASG